MRVAVLKPRHPGLLVRDPVSGVPLKEEGQEKPLSPFWLRRLKCGDVDEAPAAVESKSKK